MVLTTMMNCCLFIFKKTMFNYVNRVGQESNYKKVLKNEFNNNIKRFFKKKNLNTILTKFINRPNLKKSRTVVISS